jgi:hypothetical protein
METRLIITKFFVLLCIMLYGQEIRPPFQSKIADLGEIQLEYMDFGGEGIPFIWVQDFHNYFEGPYKDSIYYPFFTNLAREVRVLAPLRRGYGKSTFTKWGYDVATQSEDLLKFMDAVGIEKAVLFGRLPANQDMTWIAEHHPNRVAGLIYWGNPILIAGCSYPDEIALVENLFAITAPDFEKEQEKIVVMTRAFWRPHFLQKGHTEIHIPTLRIIHSELAKISILHGYAKNGMIERIVDRQTPGLEKELGVIKDMVADSIRFNKLKEHLIVCDPSMAIEIGMKKTFGTKLQTIYEPDFNNSEAGFKEYLDWLAVPVLSFLKEIRP